VRREHHVGVDEDQHAGVRVGVGGELGAGVRLAQPALRRRGADQYV
jgi:hypothetical protein